MNAWMLRARDGSVCVSRYVATGLMRLVVVLGGAVVGKRGGTGRTLGGVESRRGGAERQSTKGVRRVEWWFGACEEC